MKYKTPQAHRLAAWILKKCTGRYKEYNLVGDFDEEFHHLAESRGTVYATMWYYSHVLKSVPYFFSNSLYWSFAMIGNYLKIAYRNMLNQKGYSSINIAGLAIGTAVCLLIMMYVANEMSYENFHEKRDRIYRVAVDFGSGNNILSMPGAMPGLAPELRQKTPGVENAVRILNHNSAALNYQGNTFQQDNIFFAEQQLFDIFSFELIHGSPGQALTSPFSAVISESAAFKYFGKSNPLGESLLFDNEHTLRITGVMKNIPVNTHIPAELFISYSTLKPLGMESGNPWEAFGGVFTYILLTGNTQIEQVQPELTKLLLMNNENLAQNLTFIPEKLTDIHFNTRVIFDWGSKGNYMYIRFFTVTALLVLFIACMNFINLSTARSLKRMKEVGLRRVFGAQRTQLIQQFLGESLLITAISILIGFGLFILLYPDLNLFLDATINVDQSDYSYLYLLIPGMIIAVGFITGLFPALHLSRFKPVENFRIKTLTQSGRGSFRKALVVTQFSITVILLIVTFVIFNQIDFMKKTDLGFEKDNVLTLSLRGGQNRVSPEQYNAIRTSLESYTDISSVSGSFTLPGKGGRQQVIVKKPGDMSDDDYSMQAIAADFGFANTLGLNIMSGRDFSREYATDAGQSILINEKAAEMFEFSDPLNRKILIPVNQKLKEMTIIGIVKDFHLKSLKSEIEPLIIYIHPESVSLISIRFNAGKSKEVLAAVNETWKAHLNDASLNYSFLDADFNRLYQAEDKIMQLLSLFSVIAVTIACLGLFGLASFMAEQRKKEMSVRKVLGASVSGIITLLSKEYTKWVIAANIIAWPVAYYAADKWLQGFAYRIDLDFSFFLITGFTVLLTALLTVSYQSVKVGKVNPADSLRYE